MNKIFLAAFVVLIAFGLFGFVSASMNVDAGKKLVESKMPCNQMSGVQLEQVGDYYMELMHPDQAHELMDQMMGGEGSESLKSAHINMAKTLYCGDKTASYGMMGSGMMNGGMMNMMGNSLGYGMMGNSLGYSTGWSVFFSIFWILLMAGILIVIILVIVKLLKSM